MGKIFGRDQVAWLAAIAAVFQVVTGYGFDVSGHTQGIVTAVVVFVFAVWNAIHVHDGVIALVTGVMTALFSLFAAFNLDWTTGKQVFWIAAVTAVLGLFVRTQVTSPVPASVSPAGKLVE
jgi:hypothetical protein